MSEANAELISINDSTAPEKPINDIETGNIDDNVTDEILETKTKTPEENDTEINIEASVDEEGHLINDASNTDINISPEIVSQNLEIESEIISKDSQEHDKIGGVISQESPNDLVTPDVVVKNVVNSNESVIIQEEYDGNISEKISELFLTDSSDITSNLETNQSSGFQLEVKISTEREECLNKYRELIAEKTQLTLKNTLFHKKLAEYFKKRKITPAVKEYGDEAEKERHYHNLLLKYEKMKNEETLQKQMMQEKLDESRKVLDSRQQEFKTSFTAFQELEKATGIGSIHSTTGKRLSEKVVNKYLARQSKKMEDVSCLRLQCIRYKNMIEDTEKKLRELNKLGEGLHMSVYEHLLMENQNLMKKLEERDEELARQRNLCMEYNQILAHIKEEMHCEDEKCETAEYNMTNTEQQFTDARERLTSAKKMREALKSELVKEYSRCGLLANQNLLGDYEGTLQMASELRTKKEVLQEEVNYLRAKSKSPKQLLSSETVTSSSRVRPRLHRTANLMPSIGDCYYK